MDLAVGGNAITGRKHFRNQDVPINARIEGPILLDGSSLEIALIGLPLKPGYKARLRTFNGMNGTTQWWIAEVGPPESVKTESYFFEATKVTLTSPADKSSAVTWIELGGSHRLIKSEVTFGTPSGMVKVTRLFEG
jgi:hypothetical protein